MRYLNRKLGEALKIDKDAEVVILNIRGNNVTLGILEAQESHQKNLFQLLNKEILIQSGYRSYLSKSLKII